MNLLRIRPIAFTLALAACAFTQATLTEKDADACGPVTAEDTISNVIESHFLALNAHEREPLLGLWKEKATVVSLSEPVLVEPVEKAATRWLSAKNPVTFQIQRIDVADKASGSANAMTATALVNVVFEGVKHEDRMALVRNANERTWRIAGKSSRPVAVAAVAAKTPSALRY